MMKEIAEMLEELSSDRHLNNKYGPAVLQGAILVELRKLRAAIEKSNKGPAAQRAKRRQKKSDGQTENP